MKYFEKYSRISGDVPGNHISYNVRVPIGESMPGYSRYLESKAKENPSSLPVVAGAGLGIGAAAGYMLNKVPVVAEHKLNPLLVMGLMGAAGLVGAYTRYREDLNSIQKAKSVISSNSREAIRTALIKDLDAHDWSKNKPALPRPADLVRLAKSNENE